MGSLYLWAVILAFAVFSSVQFSHSVVSNSLQPHELQASLFITNSRSLLKLMSIESVMLLLMLLSHVSCVQLCVTP